LHGKSEPSNNRSRQATTATAATTRLSSTFSRPFGKSLQWSVSLSITKGTTASTTDSNCDAVSEEVSSQPVIASGAMVSRQDSQLLDAGSKNEGTAEEAEEAKAEEETEVEHHHDDGLLDTCDRPEEDAEEATKECSKAEHLQEDTRDKVEQNRHHDHLQNTHAGKPACSLLTIVDLIEMHHMKKHSSASFEFPNLRQFRFPSTFECRQG